MNKTLTFSAIAMFAVMMGIAVVSTIPMAHAAEGCLNDTPAGEWELIPTITFAAEKIDKNEDGWICAHYIVTSNGDRIGGGITDNQY